MKWTAIYHYSNGVKNCLNMAKLALVLDIFEYIKNSVICKILYNSGSTIKIIINQKSKYKFELKCNVKNTSYKNIYFD